MARTLVGATIIAAAAVTGDGCAHHGPPAPATVTAGEAPPAAADLPLPDRIPGDLTLRQKLTAQSAHGGGSFETILQKRAGVLRVVGLTPFGTRAFLLEQRDHQVDFTSYIPRELPFSPTFMLLEIHRVFDTWLDGPPPADGERTGTVGGERINERWQAGQLRQRTFVRAHPPAPGAAPGTVTITYQGQIQRDVAADIFVANSRYGYQLSIHSLPAGN